MTDTKYKMTVSQTYAHRRPLPAQGGALGRGRVTVETFFNSTVYFPAMILFGAVCIFLGLQIPGMVVLAVFVTVAQLTCPDLMVNVLPLVMFLLFGTRYYDNIGSLLPLGWIIPMVLGSFIYNLVHWKTPLRRGFCFKSLIAVSLAALLGGVGYISAKEYFSPMALYYTLGLGAAMLLVSLVFDTNLSRPRSYDLADRFCKILYVMGVISAFVVVNYYIVHFAEFMKSQDLLYISYRNYLTTMFLMALPAPFRYVRRSRMHICSIVFMYCALLVTGSRSGLLFGTIIVFMCMFLSVRQSVDGKKRRWLLLANLAAAGALIFVLCNTLLSSRMVDGSLFPVTDSRLDFMKQSVLDFLANPLTGIGLGNLQNSNIFIGVGGSMVWYHNYFAQIIGSMGILGIIAYGWLLRDRARLLWGMFKSGEAMLCMSYVGMFLVSMTNPGEFCPLPNAFLVVVLFSVADNIRSSKAKSTISGETVKVTWSEPSRGVAGQFDLRHNTVSSTECTSDLVIEDDTEDGENTKYVTVYRRFP